MPAPRGQKAATKPGRRAAAQASGPTTQLDELPDSVLGLILSLAGDSCGPNISAVSRRWRRVWYSEPAVWREFVLRPVPPPEAALRLDRLWHGGEEDWQPASEGSLSETEVEAVAEAVAEWWECASERQVAAGFAARRRQLRQTAHMVTHARLDYGCSGLQEQSYQPSGWKLWQVVRELPASLEGLHLDSWMEMEDVTRGEAKELVAATTDALARFSQLTALQLNVNTLPKSAAAALARLTGLSNLSLQAGQITPAVVDGALALSRLTSLALHPVEGLLPVQRLADLPQRLPLLANLDLSESAADGEGLEDFQLPAPADFPHLRTYSYGFEFCRRRFQVGGVPLVACSYQEERAAGGGLPLWKCRLATARSGGRQRRWPWPAGPPQGRLRVKGAALAAGSTLQQLLERLLPPRGISLGALELDDCRFTPAQCSDCPLLQGLNELAVKSPRFLPDGYTAAQAEEFSFAGRPSRPPQGSAADQARKAAFEPVLAALMAQMPRLERLTAPGDDGVPACVVQHTGLRFLDMDGGYLTQLPRGPYLQSLETLFLDTQGFERLPRALAAATRCRYLSMNLCYHMDITRKDVDDILVKMTALQELHLYKAESWNPYSYPLPLLLYMQQRLPGVRVFTMAREFGGSCTLSDFGGSEEDGDGGIRDSEGGGSGWDSEGGGSEYYYLGSEEEEEQQPAGGSRAGASGSRRLRAKAEAAAKPAAKARPAAKGRTAAGAGKGKGKQPAKGKAAAAAKPAVKPRPKGKGAQGKSKQQQQPPRKRRGGKPISAGRLAWLRCAALLHSRTAAVSAPTGRGGAVAPVAAAAPRRAPAEHEAFVGGSSSQEEPTAAYMHLPFCKRKCSYCDFPVIAVGQNQNQAQSGHWQDQMAAYVQLLARELEASQRLNEGPLQTVFFGGGTPSLLSLPLLEQLLQALDRRFGLAAGAEISIEADPGTFDAARLRSYMGMGITRVSVGVQTFQDELLALCGRAHDAADVFRAVEAVHAAGVPSWSLDLMSGLPQLTEEAWGRSLEQAIDAGPHHISTYDLQVEEGTPFARRYSPGEAPLPTDASAAAMYCRAAEVLGAAGFEHYEVSNYALPGHRCRHNMVYWEGLPYYAFGMGAASYLEGRRFSRPPRLNSYRQWVEQYAGDAEHQGPRVAGSWLPRESGDDKLLDTIMLRLRLADGLDLRQLAAQHVQGEEAVDIVLRALQPHIQRGWVLTDQGSGWSSGSSGGGGSDSGSRSSDSKAAVLRVRLADPQGFLVSNDIISDCFAAFDITSQED